MLFSRLFGTSEFVTGVSAQPDHPPPHLPSPSRPKTSFGTQDHYYWYFYPDAPERSDWTKRVALFAQVDSLGYVPGKLKRIAYEQKIIDSPNEVIECFKRPVNQRKPIPEKGYVG